MSGQKSYGVGDLPKAVAISDTDTLPICQSPSGCFANDASVTLKGASQSQLVTYYRARFYSTAPITYDFASGTYGLAFDPATLAIVGGKLTVIGGGPGPGPGPSGGGPVEGGGGGVVTGGGGGVVTGGGTGSATTSGASPQTGGGEAPLEGGGGAVLTGSQEAALLRRIAELETRLAALEATE